MTYEIIGSKERAVAIIGLKTKQTKFLAKTIMKTHKNVKSVLEKTGERTGAYRVHPCKLILGDKNTEVVHKENGYSLLLDPQKVYFSQRESTERSRVAKLVKPNENILIMFSGIAPYALAIKKIQPTCKITCIEINPYAINYANKNVKLNKMKGIVNYLADVRDIKTGKFDRIIMPLPETSLDYLDTALNFAKKNAIIHLYTFTSDVSKTIKEVENICDIFNFNCKIIDKQKVLPHSPGVFKTRIDLQV